MIFECPDCGARVRGGAPGSVVACGRCQNPLVVPEATAPSPPAPVAAPRPAQPAPARVSAVWRVAALVVLILALAHLGLYLLLTMDARAGVQQIEARYSRAELEAAHRPGLTPEPGTPAFTAWSRSVALWEEAEAYEVHARQVMLLRTGLFISFLVLVGITAWALLGILRRLAPRSADGSR